MIVILRLTLGGGRDPGGMEGQHRGRVSGGDLVVCGCHRRSSNTAGGQRSKSRCGLLLEALGGSAPCRSASGDDRQPLVFLVLWTHH